MSEGPWTYEIPAEPVARGGQAAVYYATRSDGMAVALKVAGADTTSRRALQREAEALRALEAAGVAGVMRALDLTDVDGAPALVMKRFPDHLGTWLAQVVREPGEEDLGLILERLADLATVLGHVHRTDLEGRSLIHRDVKPENVFVDHDGRLYLGDFGAALAIDGLAELELAMCGTPLWAPLDQVLPGRAIPDPTWDTYALCVILFVCLTGSRPAYQADPRELLTAWGRQLWELAQRAIAGGPAASQLRRAFADERYGTKARDLVDLTGRGALVDADRRGLEEGVARLSALAGLDPSNREALTRGLWKLLVRGLSPVSHPSPPNRFRDALELAEELDELRALVVPSVGEVLPPAEDDEFVEVAVRRRRRRLGFLPVALVLSVGIVACAVGALTLPRMEIPSWWVWGQVKVPRSTVLLDGQEVEVPPFRLDRREVRLSDWQECVLSGGCPRKKGDGSEPVVGVSFHEARHYCEAWAEGRLPSQVEWLAAYGPDTWPWGEEAPTCEHAHLSGCPGEGVLPAGARTAGVSALGVHDLVGNAWEWVEGTGGVPLLVGGGADVAVDGASRTHTSQEELPLAGVRCAYDAW